MKRLPAPPRVARPCHGGALAGARRSRAAAPLVGALPLAILCAFAPPPVHANPTGSNVTTGQASFAANGKTLTITNTPGTIINWQGFSIGADELTRFIQQGASSSVLNRVVGQDPSKVLGQLQSNGRVFLINPNGIVFGTGARVDVGGLVASTLDLSDADFRANRLSFAGPSAAAGLSQLGTIRTASGGQVVLIAPKIENGGVIETPQGELLLAAGHSVQLADTANPELRVTVTAPAGEVLNLGALIAQGGRIGVHAGLIQQAGTISADRAEVGAAGEILLKASGPVTLASSSRISANGASGGRVVVEGDSVQASGHVEAIGSTGAGGSIRFIGDSVTVPGGVFDASGATRGGEILVGGDLHGASAGGPTARSTTVGGGAVLRADATGSGDGGKVVVWSDEDTAFAGAISARGGSQGGAGGMVEVSGKRTLAFDGTVDTRAPLGATGTLLLDPTDITISTAANSSISAGPTFTGSAASSTLNVTTLQTALASNNVVVDTTSGFGSAGNITVANAVTWASANSLDLKAHNNITVNASATINATGSGALHLVANQDNAGGGDVSINAALTAHIGGISISGANITSVAAGSLTTTGVSGADGGAITINGTGAISLTGALVANGGSTVAFGGAGRAGGAITITGGSTVAYSAASASGSAASGAGFAGGAGGSIGVTSNGTISTLGASPGLVASGGSGGTGNAAGGNAGTITITNLSTTAGNVSTGSLTAQAGVVAGTGASGTPGSVTVVSNNATAGAMLTVGAVNVTGGSGSGGGTVGITSASDITTSSTVQASGGAAPAGSTRTGAAAGSVAINGVNVTDSGTITVSGGSAAGTNQTGGAAGTVSITAASALNAAAVTVSTGAATGTGTGDAAGTLTLQGTSVSAGALTTTGGANGAGGAISATATGGALNLTAALVASGGAANASSPGSKAGNVTLSGTGVTTLGLTANGSAGATAGSSQPGGAGGAIQVNSTGGINVSTVGASGGAATSTDAAGGSGGSITLANSSAGNVVTTTLTSASGSATGTGAAGSAGGVSVTNTAGGIQTTTISTAGGTKGNGGNVLLNASGALSLGGTITASGGAAAGSMQGADAGSVTLRGTSVTATVAPPGNFIAASGGNAVTLANARGGNAGAISVTATAGAINLGSTNPIVAIGGNAVAGVGAGGAGAALTFNATGDVTAGAITAHNGNAFGTGGAGGSAATVGVSGANVSLGAITTTGGSDGNASTLNVSASGTITTGAITASGGAGTAATAGGNAGAISLVSSGAGVTTGAIIASGGTGGAGTGSAGGNASTVTVSGFGTIAASTITANGGAAGGTTASGGNAGVVAVTNNSTTAGTLTTSTLTVRTGAATGATLSGARGSVTVTNKAPTLLQTGGIDASGTAGSNGGDIALTSFGGITAGSTISSSGGALGAGLAATGRSAGNITIAGIDRNLGFAVTANGGAAIVSGSSGGAAGTVTMTGSDGTAATAGSLTTTGVTASTGNSLGTGAGGTPGSLRLEGTNVGATTLTTTGGTNGNGGTIAVTASSLLSVSGAITSSGGAAAAGTAGPSAGSVTLAGQAIATAAITAAGSAGSGTDMAGGAGANVSVIATGGNVSVGAIGAGGGTGSAGNSNGGNAGSITLDAGGATPTITIGGNLTARGGNRFGTGIAGTGAPILIRDAALLSATPLTFDASGGSGGTSPGGDIHFYSTVDSTGGARALTTNTNATAIWDAAAGATSPLLSVTTTALGATRINGGSITTTSGQTWANTVTLGAPTTLDAGGGTLTSSGTIDGGYALNATTTGSATFTGALGATTPLARLATTAQTLTITNATVAGGAGSTLDLTASRNIVANGALTSNGAPINLAANTAATATGTVVGVRLSGATLDAGGGDITVTGIGGNSGASHGIQATTSAVRTTGSGSISLNGTGGGTGNGINWSGTTAAHVITTVNGNITLTGTGSSSAYDVVYSGLNESALRASGTGTVALRALGTADANGLSIGTTGTALDFYGSALNTWQLQTASNLAFTGLGVSKTTGGNASWTLTAPGSVVFTGNAGINVTSGKLDIVFDPVAGAVNLGTGNFRSNGGNIVIAGGTNPGGLVNAALPATGAHGTSAYPYGVALLGGTIDAQGGNVSIMGTGAALASDQNYGIYTQGTVQTSGAGGITMNGYGGGTGASGTNGGVVLWTGTVRTTGTGPIAITGTGGSTGSGANAMGVRIYVSNTVTATGSGSITITGHSGDNGVSTYNPGIDVGGNVVGSGGTVTVNGVAGNALGDYNVGVTLLGTISNTGSGLINVLGNGGTNPLAGTNNHGIGLAQGTVSGVNGTVTIVGQGGQGTGVNDGLELPMAGVGGYAQNTLRTTGSGTLALTGVAGSNGTGIVGNAASVVQTTGTGNIVVTTDGLTLGAANAVSSARNLTIQPYTAGTSIGIGSSAGGTLALSDTTLGDLAWGSGNLLSIGSVTAGAVTVNTPTTFASPLAVVSGSGADITLAGTLTSTSAAAAPTLTLAAGRNFVNTAGAGALVPGANGTWQVWSTNPGADSRGGLAPDFKQYAATYGVTAPAASGDGLFYRVAPTLAPTLVGTVGKTYDGNTTATLASGNVAASGALDGDTIVLGGGTATYDTRHAGSGKTVSATGFTLASASNGGMPVYGYTLSSTTASAAVGTITPATLVLAASPDARTYNGTTASTGAPTVVSGLVGGDSVSGLVQAFDSKNAGARSLVVTGYTVNDGNAGGNYSVSTQAAAGSIAKAALVLGAVADTKTYDGTVASGAAPTVISGLATGDSVSSLVQAYDSKNAGARTLSVSGYTLNDGNAGGNYNVTTQTAAGSIAKAALVLGAAGDTKTYDGTTASSATPIVVSGLAAGDSVTALTQAYDARHAGTRSLAVTGYSVSDGNGGNNYTVSTQGAAGSITPATLVLAAAPDSKTYDGSTTSAAAPTVASGLVAGDSVSGLAQAFDSRNAGARSLVVTGSTVADGNGGGNYTVTTQTAPGTIAKAALVLGAVGDNKAYDGTTASSATPIVVSGLVSGDSVTGLTQTFDSKNAGARTLGISGFTVSDGNGGGNYTVTNQTASGTIAKAALVLGAVADNKTYDGTTTSSATPTVVSGLVSGDSIGGFTQTFDSRNAGARTLGIAGYTVTDGNGGNNYTVTTQTAPGSIAKATLVLGATADNKTYDGTTTSSAASIVVSGLVSGDSVGAMSQSFDSKNAGTRTLAITGYTVADGNGGGNYAVTTQTAAGSIAKAALVLGATADTKTYDGTTASSAAPIVVSGLAGGDSVGAMSQSFDSKNAGARNLALTGYTIVDGNGGNNYTVTTQTAAGSIAKATLVLGATTDSKTYDGTTVSSAAPIVVSGLVSGDSVGAMSQSFDSKNAGARTLGVTGFTIADGNGGNNYAVSFASTAGSIAPAPLSITADNKSRVVAGPNPPFTAIYSGFVAGETPAVLGGTLSLTTPATPASPAGAYAIVPSGHTSSNYSIAYVNGTLTVMAAPAPAPGPPGPLATVAAEVAAQRDARLGEPAPPKNGNGGGASAGDCPPPTPSERVCTGWPVCQIERPSCVAKPGAATP
jgi:filamentous hemagglutinin family protein